MTRITLTIDPMPAAREQAKRKVDGAFNREAAAAAHLDAAYAVKRDLARRAVAGDEAAVAALADEAQLRGISAADLAADIITKPDTLADREARRQALLAQIRAAATPGELEQLVKRHG
ncbi:hypothetical protein [Rhodopseudomonas sp.]|uniref:hypothetical protein n=1 Tax=Rhodopseudomonas sp. TaxID=1078 RepID=UPI003B3A2CD7